MSKTAFLFPGQGAQAVGMGVALAGESGAARAVFEAVNDALGEDLFALMKEGPDETLKLTRNAQPALFASALAVVRAVEEKTGQNLHSLGSVVAGHSLGEYAALAAAGVLSLDDAARLLRLRGDSMQEAVPVGEGAMAALLGADMQQVQDIIANAASVGLVQIANDNAPGQIVVSGTAEGVDAAIAAAKEAGLKRALKLPVSAPFHCDLMAPAADIMADALASTEFQEPTMTVFCNVTADAETSAVELRANLVTQVCGRVRWRESLEAMQQAGVSRFVELGTGKVLSGLVKRTLSDVEIANAETMSDIEAVFGA